MCACVCVCVCVVCHWVQLGRKAIEEDRVEATCIIMPEDFVFRYGINRIRWSESLR